MGMRILSILLFLSFISCENITKENEIMSLVNIDKKPFGVTKDGIDINQYILKNANGMQITVINYGGIITSWKAKDRDGSYEDIVLGLSLIHI